MYVQQNGLPSSIVRRTFLYSHRVTDSRIQEPVVFSVRPTVDEDRGLPGVGLCINTGEGNFNTCAVLSFDADKGEYYTHADPVGLAEFASKCPNGFTFAEILSAIPYALCMPWLRFNSYEPLGEEDIQNVILGSLPEVAVLQDHGSFTSMHATVLRDICNATGVKPSSIKKNDCLDALAACRNGYMAKMRANDDHAGDIEDKHGLRFCLRTTENQTPALAVYKTDDAGLLLENDPTFKEWLAAADHATFRFIHDELVLGDPAAGEVTIDPARVRTFIDSKRGEVQSSIKNSVVGSDWIEASHSILGRDNYVAWSQVLSLKSEIAQMAALAAQNETKVKQLISSIRASTEVVLPGAGGEVEVMGKMLPYYGDPDAPAAIPNYSLDFWSAKQRLGAGANTVKFDALDFIDAVLHDSIVSQVGPPGTGKTTIVRQAAHVLGLPCFIVQFTRDKPIESLIGVDKIQNSQQVFVDGEITLALRRAASNPDVPVLVCFDEFDHAPPEIQSDFHGVVEGRDYTLPSGEVIPNHGNLRFVLTRNTSGHGDQSGRHSAANVSDSAFNSRIKSAFNVDYMEASDESVLLMTHGLDLDESEAVVKFANATRQSVANLDSGESYDGMTEPVCLRHLLSYAAARSRGVSRDKALAQCIVAQLPERDRTVCNEIIVTHFKFD